MWLQLSSCIKYTFTRSSSCSATDAAGVLRCCRFAGADPSTLAACIVQNASTSSAVSIKTLGKLCGLPRVLCRMAGTKSSRTLQQTLHRLMHARTAQMRKALLQCLDHSAEFRTSARLSLRIAALYAYAILSMCRQTAASSTKCGGGHHTKETRWFHKLKKQNASLFLKSSARKITSI